MQPNEYAYNCTWNLTTAASHSAVESGCQLTLLYNPTRVLKSLPQKRPSLKLGDEPTDSRKPRAESERVHRL
jgi:hypothetical protein